ncbi:MAG: hypothetical protein CMM48_02880 [Rhodospirillaceae bacterium]|nr:hypothetical protein [Rhodospirillaceae bacterium]HAA91802.1 hypothetical protein [Rhodospirillaceae bacterium]
MESAVKTATRGAKSAAKRGRPTRSQIEWLKRGLDQPGGKLPLFDEYGQKVSERTVKSCIAQGWAEPWFDNPTKPDWLVCKLTEKGRELASK